MLSSAPLGFGSSSSTEPCASQITQAGEYIKNFLVSTKSMAESFGLYQAHKDSPSALVEAVQDAPEYLRLWKEYSARHRARMAFSAIKSIYKEVDIPYYSKDLSATNNHGEKNDPQAL